MDPRPPRTQIISGRRPENVTRKRLTLGQTLGRVFGFGVAFRRFQTGGWLGNGFLHLFPV